MSFPQLPFGGIRSRRISVTSSDLIVEAIALTASGGELKYADSALVAENNIFTGNVSTPSLATSSLEISPTNTESSINSAIGATSNLLIPAVNVTSVSTAYTVEEPVNLLGKTKAYFGFDNSSTADNTFSVGNQFKFIGYSGSLIYRNPKLGSYGLEVGGLADMFNGDGSSLDPTVWGLDTTKFIGASIWVKFSNIGNFSSPPILRNSNSNFTLGIRKFNPFLEITDFSFNLYTITLPTSIVPFEFYLIGFEIDKNTGIAKLRINNNTPVTGNCGITAFNEPSITLITNDGSNLSVVDELYFYNAPLNETEWNTLYNGGLGLAYPF